MVIPNNLKFGKISVVKKTRTLFSPLILGSTESYTYTNVELEAVGLFKVRLSPSKNLVLFASMIVL